MKYAKGQKETLTWIQEQSAQTTGKLLAVLNEELSVNHVGVPREITIAIHNLALLNVYRTINMPRTAILGLVDPAEDAKSYEEFPECPKMGQLVSEAQREPEKPARKKWTRKASDLSGKMGPQVSRPHVPATAFTTGDTTQESPHVSDAARTQTRHDPSM